MFGKPIFASVEADHTHLVDKGTNSVGVSVHTYANFVKEQGIPTKEVKIYVDPMKTTPQRVVNKTTTILETLHVMIGEPIMGSVNAGMWSIVGVGMPQMLMPGLPHS